MIKIIKSSISFLAFLVLFISIFTTTPAAVRAQSNTGNNCDGGIFPNIVVCGRTPQTTCPTDPLNGKDTTKPCTASDFVETLSRVLLFGLTFILIMIPLAAMYIGVKLMYYQDKAYKLSEIKGQVVSLFIGIIVVLASWIIVREIVRAFGVKDDIPNFLLNRDGSKADITPQR